MTKSGEGMFTLASSHMPPDPVVAQPLLTAVVPKLFTPLLFSSCQKVVPTNLHVVNKCCINCRPHRGPLLHTEQRGLSVCLSVGHVREPCKNG